MKHTINTMLGLGLTALAPFAALAQDTPAAPAPAPTEAPAPAAPTVPATPSKEEVKSVFSYLMGYQFGQQLAMENSTISAGDIDDATFFKAMADGISNQVDPAMREKDIRLIMDTFMQELQDRAAKRSAENLAKGKAFLEENAKKEGVVTTKSGLQYKVITPGDGRKFDQDKDGKNAVCSVIYEGRLIDGTVFDATEDPVEFPINAVVPGFSEALKAMPIGSEWEIYIPANLGYGEQGPGVIGNNSTLVFKLKLTDIKPGQGTSENPYELTPEMLQQLQEQGLVPAQDEAATK